MLALHQIHRVRPGRDASFESLVRDRWLPAVATIDGCRFAWYATATPIARHSDEVATITIMRDGTALDGFLTEVRGGRLTSLAKEIRDHRSGSETRMMLPIDYDPWTRSGVEVPDTAQDGPVVAYMHDFVPPEIGQMRGYASMMRDRYMALTEKDLSGVVLRTSWQTVPGGGPLPEMFNLSEIRDVGMLNALLVHEIPREQKAMGSWMWEALAVRDRWTTRLLRCASWSPVK